MREFDDFNLNELKEVLDKKHRDTAIKEIGDRVNIIDYSSCTHLNGRPLDYELDDDEMCFNFNTELIVIATRQNINYDTYYVTYRQDLVVVNTLTNKKYCINSGHVTLK